MGRGETTGLDVIPAGQARQDMKKIFDRAIHDHLPVPLERGAAERMFGLGGEELTYLLSIYEFHPEVIYDDDVSIWLPEFGIYGSGESYEEAKSDLLEEVLEYIHTYFDKADPSLRQAPNRRHHYPHALRAAIAVFDDQLESVLFAQPREFAGAGV